MNNICIANITIVSFEGSDTVIINTTLPSGIWPFEGNAHVKLDVAHGRGEQYVKDNFPGVEYKLISKQTMHV